MKRTLLAALCSLSLAACAHAPEVVPGPAAATALDPGGAFAWDVHEQRIAFAGKGLRIRDLQGREELLAAASPTGVCWSPDGTHLAAAWPSKTGSTLKILDLKGMVVREAAVAGTVRGLAWGHEAGIVASAADVQRWSFGGHLRTLLHRWPATGEPTLTVASETTLMPAVAHHIGTDLVRGQQLALAPLEDEVVYSRIVSPPDIPPYTEIVLRHLATGAEKSVARASLAPGQSTFTPEGEEVVVCEGGPICRRIDPWSEQSADVQNPHATAERPPLQKPAPSLPAAQRARLLELRKLRDQALITPDDYRAQKAKALQP